MVLSTLPNPRERRRNLRPRERREVRAPVRVQSGSLGKEVLSFLLLMRCTFSPPTSH